MSPIDAEAHVPPTQHHECQHCGFIAKSVPVLQKHQKNKHPNSELINGMFKCIHCDKVWSTIRGRSRHQAACINKTPSEQQSTFENLKLPTDSEETMPHILECNALKLSRERHKTYYYHGSRYLYSLKFLRWVHSLFNGTQGTETINEEVLPPSRQSE